MQTTVKNEYGKDVDTLSGVAAKAATDVANRAKDSVRELIDEGRSVAEENFAATSKWFGTQTRDNPVRTLGIAAVVGIVIGMLIGRR